MRVLDLCSGIGGFSLAAEWMGWEVAGHVEIDSYCAKVLRKHWPNVLQLCDITKVEGDEFGAIDLVCGGIPCQPFSVAGSRLGAADERHLWPHADRIIATIRPRWVVIENVGNFASVALDDVSADLESLGYRVESAVLPACAIGANHKRERIWIVAHATSQRQPSRKSDSRDQSSSEVGNVHAFDGADAVGVDPNADSAGLEGCRRQRELRQDCEQVEAIRRVDDDARSEPAIRNGRQSRLRAAHDGVPGRMARFLDDRWRGDPMNAFASGWTDGVPYTALKRDDHRHRIKALGNSLVPQLAYQIFLAIAAIDAASQDVP